MVNHARTLLLNVDGSSSPGLDYPGEEYVQPSYTAVSLTPLLTALRRILFGGAPDRLMLNYRLRQIMTALHAVELEEHVLAFDRRITYWPKEDDSLFKQAFGVKATQNVDQVAVPLYLSGSVAPDDASGRLVYQWRVEETGIGSAKIQRLTPPGEELEHTYDVANNLGAPLALHGSSLFCRLGTGPGSVWTVDASVPPGRSLSDVTADLMTFMEADKVNAIFGLAPIEPFLAFRNLWLNHDLLPYRLGGLVLAIIYRIDELRNKGAA